MRPMMAPRVAARRRRRRICAQSAESVDCGGKDAKPAAVTARGGNGRLGCRVCGEEAVALCEA